MEYDIKVWKKAIIFIEIGVYVPIYGETCGLLYCPAGRVAYVAAAARTEKRGRFAAKKRLQRRGLVCVCPATGRSMP